MSLLGYDPIEHFTGRAPLEAAAQGIALADEDWAIRCNLVTIEDQVMRDFTAGHITDEEARRSMLGRFAAVTTEHAKLHQDTPELRMKLRNSVSRASLLISTKPLETSTTPTRSPWSGDWRPAPAPLRWS